MEYFQDNRFNINLSKIAIGCMNWGGDWNRFSDISSETIKKAEEIFTQSIELGYNIFDLADIYCWGKSEIVFGKALSNQKYLRDKIFIQTKCGIIPKGTPYEDSPHRYDLSKRHIINSVNESLKRLQIDYIDAILMHRPDPLFRAEEIAEAFEHLRSQGKVRFLGVSNFNSSQIQRLLHAQTSIFANQIQFSLFHTFLIDAGTEFNNAFKSKAYAWGDILDYCEINNILIQAYSPLGKGLLFKDQNSKYENLKVLLNKISIEKNVSIETILISWLLKLPYKIQPIVGTTNLERIKQLANSKEDLLTREEWYSLYLAARGDDIP